MRTTQSCCPIQTIHPRPIALALTDPTLGKCKPSSRHLHDGIIKSARDPIHLPGVRASQKMRLHPNLGKSNFQHVAHTTYRATGCIRKSTKSPTHDANQKSSRFPSPASRTKQYRGKWQRRCSAWAWTSRTSRASPTASRGMASAFCEGRSTRARSQSSAASPRLRSLGSSRPGAQLLVIVAVSLLIRAVSLSECVSALCRWAVKEATYKAFQRYRVLFPEIRLVKQSPSDNDSASATDAKIFTPVQTKLSVAESSQALRLEFYGETLALAEQLSLVVRVEFSRVLTVHELLLRLAVHAFVRSLGRGAGSARVDLSRQRLRHRVRRASAEGVISFGAGVRHSGNVFWTLFKFKQTMPGRTSWVDGNCVVAFHVSSADFLHMHIARYLAAASA